MRRHSDAQLKLRHPEVGAGLPRNSAGELQSLRAAPALAAKAAVCACILACGQTWAADRLCNELSIKPLLSKPVPGSAAGSAYTLSLNDPERFRLRRTDASKPGLSEALASRALALRPYSVAVRHAANAFEIDAELVHAVITFESNYNPKAVSPKGALGLMQLMPDTARRYGLKDTMRPECNIRAGTAYLRDLMTLFDGDLNLVVAAYNAGENAVIRYGMRIPPYEETRLYVPKVIGLYTHLKPPPPKADSKSRRYPHPLTSASSNQTEAFARAEIVSGLGEVEASAGPSGIPD